MSLTFNKFIVLLIVIVLIITTTIFITIIFKKEFTDEVQTLSDNDENLSLPKYFASSEKIEIKSSKKTLDLSLNFKIPQNIVQTNHSSMILPGMAAAVKTIKILNPEFDYYYFNDEECLVFIKENFDEDVVSAYQSILPGAYKADIFRVCFLIIKGGVYLDTGFVGILPLRELLKEEDEFVAPEDNYFSVKYEIPYIHNAFLASIPNHPILISALKSMVNKIKNKSYENDCLGITGPIALGEVFADYFNVKIIVGNKSYSPSVRLIQFSRNNGPKRILNGDKLPNGEEKIFFYTKYNNYDSEVALSGAPKYGEVYRKRNVYGEKEKNISIPIKNKNIVEKITALYRPIPLANKKTLIKIDKKIKALIPSKKKILQICEDYVPIRAFNAMETVKNLNIDYSIERYNFSEMQEYLEEINTDEDFYNLSDEEFEKIFLKYYLKNNENTVFVDYRSVCIVPFREIVGTPTKKGNLYIDENDKIVMYHKYTGSNEDESSIALSKNTDLLTSKGYSYLLPTDLEYTSTRTEKLTPINKLKKIILESDNQIKQKTKYVWIRNSSKGPNKGDLVNFVKYILPEITRPFILITTDGDRSVPSGYSPQIVEKLLSSVYLLKWYTQNYSGSDNPKILSVPIGLNRHDYPIAIRKDIKQHFLNLRKEFPFEGRSNKILVDVLNKSCEERRTVQKLLLHSKNVDMLTTRKSYIEAHKEFSRHKYILSVRGNGLECHRTWEILCSGGVAILKRDSLAKFHSQFEGIHLIDDWTEILEDNFIDKLDKKYKNYQPISFKYLQTKLFVEINA